MAETDRLKEIEKWLDDPDASGFYADLRYLIARVRELEADRDMYAKMARGEIPVD